MNLHTYSDIDLFRKHAFIHVLVSLCASPLPPPRMYGRVLQVLLSDKEMVSEMGSMSGLDSLEVAGLATRDQVLLSLCVCLSIG